MGILLILTYFAIPYIIGYPLVSFVHNYIAARNSGLRFIVSPITPYTLLWQIAASLLRPVLCHFRWFRVIDWTCVWEDDDKIHKNLGRCFILVSPGLNVLCSSDPKTLEHVLRKWREFVKPDNVNEILGTFGQNVDTSNGADWQRHRKLTAPCFNERASSTVWAEALQQSKILLTQWLTSRNNTVSSVVQDTSTLALNVISAVAFESHQVNTPDQGHKLSLREALVTIMSTSISPVLERFMPWLTTLHLTIFLPPHIAKLLLAMHEFRTYMDETIARERAKPISTHAKPNLISTLLNAHNPDSKANDTHSRLSASELRGNIFVFSVGGLESTSITLTYALALLAIHPETQDWVAEEILAARAESHEYAKVFPKLVRTIAVMYETLRLYSPSPPLPRSFSTPDTAFSVPMSSGTDDDVAEITLPPDTQIMLNSWACHASSMYFASPETWDPRRWISPRDGTLLPPTFLYTWGAGPRICPGMKFSQVEFCAVLSSVLCKVRVRGEKQEVLKVLRDSVAEPLLLHVKRPEELRIQVIER